MGLRVHLTEKQSKMIDYFISNGDKKKSALMAGYTQASAESGHLWKAKLVRKELDKIYQREHEQRIMKANEILERLTSIARTEQKEEICLLNRHTIERIKKEPSIKDQFKALEILAKINNLFSENNININNQNQVMIVDDID